MAGGPKRGSRERRVFSGEVRDAEAILRADSGAQDERSVKERGLALWRLGEGLYGLGRLEEAADRLAEAAEMLSRLSPGRAAHAYGRQANALLQLGRYEEALRVADHLLEFGAQIPVELARELLPAQSLLRVTALENLGRSDEAYVAAGELAAERRLEAMRADRLLVRVLVAQAGIARSLGRPDLAHAALDEAIECCDGADEPRLLKELAQAMVKRALLFEEEGSVEAARAAYSTVATQFATASEPHLQAVVKQSERRMSTLSE